MFIAKDVACNNFVQRKTDLRFLVKMFIAKDVHSKVEFWQNCHLKLPIFQFCYEHLCCQYLCYEHFLLSIYFPMNILTKNLKFVLCSTKFLLGTNLLLATTTKNLAPGFLAIHVIGQKRRVSFSALRGSNIFADVILVNGLKVVDDGHRFFFVVAYSLKCRPARVSRSCQVTFKTNCYFRTKTKTLAI